MTVPSSTQQAGPFVGNGVATSFPFTFKCFDRAHLQWVTVTDGIETLHVLDSTYSVTLNSDQDADPGGTVTYPLTGSPMPADTTAVIVGAVPLGQATDLPDGGAFRAATVEQALDILALQILQLAGRADRSLQVPVTSSDVDAQLPAPEPGKVVGWDQTGSAMSNYDLASLFNAVVYNNWTPQTFTGNGTQQTFILSGAPGSLGNIDVSIGGVVQVAGTDYNVSGNQLFFTSAPANGAVIFVRYGSAAVQDLDADYAYRTGGNTFTGAQVVTPIPLTDATTISVDASVGNHFRVTLAGNRTLANPTNLVDGVILNFKVRQDSTGSRTLAYGSKYKWAGGTAPTLTTTALAVDYISAHYFSDQDILVCSIIKDVR